MPRTQTSSILLRGGLNLVTPAMAMPPGMVIASEGYEADVSGYTRFAGYERLDGRPKPSQAAYWVLAYDAGTTAVTAGQTVTGATSGAQGIALIDGVLESGAYGSSDAAGYLVLIEVAGTFQNDEALQVSAATVATANGESIKSGAGNDTDDATWRQAAVAERRSVITQAPGSGPIRGIWTYNGDIYAVRDDVAGTNGYIHKATLLGWEAQTLGFVLDYTATNKLFQEGEEITGTTSGAKATVRRQALTDGGTTTGDGFLVLTDITGTFQAETITGADSTASATASGAPVETILPAGGNYKSLVHNFYGKSDWKRVYFANGVGQAHDFDGVVAAPMRTGVELEKDKPTHIAEHAEHIFLGFRGGSLQNSETGNPLQWTTTGGAAEKGFGSDFADLIPSFATAMIIIGTSKIAYLTGTSNQDFSVNDLTDEPGGRPGTAQNIGGVIYQDLQGVRRLSATQAFGNFRTATLTELIEPLFEAKKRKGVTPVTSVRVKSRDIYRLFWSDKTVTSIYMGRKQPECMPMTLPFQVSCAHSGVDADGNELILVGTEDGWVYQLDVGTSFDGAEINAYTHHPFNSLGAPTINKRFQKVVLEVKGDEPATLSIMADYSYGNPDLIPTAEQIFDVSMGGGFWDVDNWNEFYWGAQFVGEAVAYIKGFGSNISTAIRSDATHEKPHTLSTLTLYFNPRRLRHP
ncbi:hypothetical protein [Roseibium sp.]|uniref:hypothetical protein n=1 Tax=Roseibium sp. TaxID=1936156 RepID=UPI003B5254D0